MSNSPTNWRWLTYTPDGSYNVEEILNVGDESLQKDDNEDNELSDIED